MKFENSIFFYNKSKEQQFVCINAFTVNTSNIIISIMIDNFKKYIMKGFFYY